MALNVTQVNAAYVALLGRAAEGQAANWAGSFASDADLARAILSVDSDFADTNKLTNEQFVEYLYTDFINKPADAEGKAFWLALLNTTNDREALVSQFIAAAKANSEDLSGFEGKNAAFIASLYTNLLGRSADDEGMQYWQDAMSAGMSQSALVAAFIQAALSNPASDDYATAAAKLNVANAVTSSFYGFKAGLSDADKEAALSEMKNIITKTDANTTIEDEQDDINNLVGNYQSNTNKGFTLKNDDLQASETSATTFVGSVNLIDDKKSTLTTADKATGNTAFKDTLVVNVTADKNNNEFTFASNVNGSNIKNIENLTINNNSASVNLTLDGTKYNNNVAITGTGDTNLTVNGATAQIVLSSGVDTVAVSGAVTVLNTNAGDDVITIKDSGSVATLDAGAGIDTVTVASGASITTVNLGAGNDTISLASGASVSGATIDGGAGNDTLKLATAASGSLADFKDIKSISNINVIELTGASDDTSGAKISYDSIKDANLKFKLSSDSSGSGSLTIDAGTNKDINLSGVKAGDTKAASIILDGVVNKAVVKLSAQDGIKETIKLGNVSSVTINGVDENDVISLASITAFSSVKGSETSFTSGSGAVSDDKNYYVELNSKKIADITASDLTGFTASSTGKKALIAVEGSDGIKFYSALSESSGGSTVVNFTEINVKLLGVTGENVDNSTLTLA
ncbi:DUF4214 domain-containing protein [Campylobacter sp. 50012-21]|uniref:DUF4214 domain-containing protein n=1 Tax=Campylobacter magnus TaxID=3026462 RepID=UPI002361E898|nr:DUF4214 domain-containing protein [Campylobacter magnus]MDD0845912.1 DUF4214 domain-containing protein [Campylobacter magnus]